MEFYRHLLVIWSVLRAFKVVMINASENMAFSKRTNQSSANIGIWGSSNAVDGCTSQTIISDCCTHTAPGHNEAWWQVDLQTTSVIDSVNIIYRNEGTLARLAGYEMYLSVTPDWRSGTRCHKDTTPALTSMSDTQDITCSGEARYLTIYNDRRVKAYPWYSDPAILELCEVQVYGCPYGKYGSGNCNKVCMNCLNNICDTTSGCNDCTSGHYKIGGDCVPCPVNCAGNTCDSLSGACSGGCKTGFSGTYCSCPANCNDAICSNGQCSACNNGFYGGTCAQCATGCSRSSSTIRVCDQSTGSCFQCNPGLYGSDCSQPCLGNCKDNVCDRGNGQCTDCNNGFYGATCAQCPTRCSRSSSTICEQSTGSCFQCNVGLYGSDCSQPCPGKCKDNVCDKVNGQCTDGCSPGFSGINCRCSVNCRDTDCPTGQCTDCNDGYYGPTCTPCPSGCSTNTCDKSSGQCTDCSLGKYGATCNLTCPSNCKSNECGQLSGECTDGCKTGFSGLFCTCPANCKDGTCSSGQCTDCNDGYYGPVCMSCPSGCTNNTCDKTSGHCVECDTGYHTMFCNQPCSENCFNKKCNMSNGQCSECVPGFHGNFCSQACPTNCKNNICSMQDGQCIETEALTDQSESQAGTYAGASVGVVVVIAVVVMVVIVVLRRRKLQTKEKTYQQKEYDDDLASTSSQPPVKSGRKRHMELSVTNDEKNEYINICGVGKLDEEVVYSNMDLSHGVTIDDIRAMIPKKMENEEEEFKKEFKALPWGAVHPHLEGTKASNKPKNRFKTTFPYDHSRVILDKIGNDPDSTYINANYIDSTDAHQAYVACQGPKEKTVDDFWRMVWQLNTGKIVMVTNLVEGGNVKCHQYWPDEGKPLPTKHFNISLDRERTYAFYVLREISLTHKKTKEERQVHQFHFTAWPDHGTPDTLELVLFHRRVTSYRTHLNGQMVVHCSAGLGRTGTFIGLDALSKEEKKSGQVDIPGYIRKMREDRMNMVQTHEQYMALHQLLVEAHDLTDSLISDTDFPETLRKILPSGKPTNQTKLRKQFEKLQTLIPKHDSSRYKAGMLKENRAKNRTMSIVAADKYRAYLRSQAGGRTDYINAVMLQSHRSKSGYLVTQFPLEGTVDDLWTMVVDYNCENLVVLGNPTEHWLREESETDDAHTIYVRKQNTLEVIPEIDIADYFVTSKNASTDMSVRIFSMKEWSSDSLLPPSNSALLLLLEQLDSRRRTDNTRPVVVMCQDGCTQSGLFCCISNARDQMKMDNEVDIFQTSRQLQARRPQALRHIEQYQFCYNFIGQYLDSTNIYIN